MLRSGELFVVIATGGDKKVVNVFVRFSCAANSILKTVGLVTYKPVNFDIIDNETLF
jgi:hypothetical protein